MGSRIETLKFLKRKKKGKIIKLSGSLLSQAAESLATLIHSYEYACLDDMLASALAT